MEELVKQNKNQVIVTFEKLFDYFKDAPTAKAAILAFATGGTIVAVETVKKGFKFSTKNFEFSVGL